MPVLLLLLGQLADPRLVVTPVGTSTHVLTGLARARDGSDRLFVLEKAGRVRLIEGGVLRPEPFVTLSPVHTNRECGLVGVALDPAFAENRWVYLFVTTTNREQRVLRFTDVDGAGREETVVLGGLPTLGTKHNGGALGFGLDGALYFGVGDNGPAVGAGDDLTSLGSKIGRATTEGLVPPGNPFDDGAGPHQDLIWARGLRNPFTLALRPVDGALWVSSVGERYDQLFVVSAGGHGGWRDYENDQPAGYLQPIIKYRPRAVDTATITQVERALGRVRFTTTATHGLRRGERVTVTGVADPSFDGVYFVALVLGPAAFEAAGSGPDAVSAGGHAVTDLIGGALTGGAFYDGTALPADYWDDYLFPDFVSNRLSNASLDAAGGVQRVEALGELVGGLTDLEVGPDGAVWIVNYRGLIQRLAATSSPGQRIIVPERHPWWVEDGPGALAVSLAAPLSATQAVDVRALDERVEVLTPRLLFAPGTERRPRALRVRTAPDLDLEPDRTRLELTTPGASAVLLEAWILDRGRRAPPDAGVLADAALPPTDGGAPAPDAEAQDPRPLDPAGGCACDQVGQRPAAAAGWLGLGLALRRRRRR